MHSSSAFHRDLISLEQCLVFLSQSLCASPGHHIQTISVAPDLELKHWRLDVRLSRIALSLCVHVPPRWHICVPRAWCYAYRYRISSLRSLPSLLSFPFLASLPLRASSPIRSDTPCRVKDTLPRDLRQNARPSRTRIPVHQTRHPQGVRRVYNRYPDAI